MNTETDNLPDLLTGTGASCGPHGVIALVTVEATSERGQSFLCAFYEAIDQQAGGLFADDEPEFLTLEPKQVGLLKRQARLAAVSMGELRDYPAYDSFA